MAAAAVVPFVTIDEYLHSVYEPDVDYVDGELEDRNVGEVDHFLVQRALILALTQGETKGGYFVIQETRLQVSPTRYRVPDTCLIKAGTLPPRIIDEAPLLCIEVLSAEDRFTRTQRKCNDYLAMGVPEVWILDPSEKVAYSLTLAGGIHEIREGSLTLPSLGIDLPLATLFARPPQSAE